MKGNNINKDGLVGFWTLNQSSLNDTDTFQDLSGNNNNGTSNNTPSFVKNQAGEPNAAMSFNGSSDYVEVADNSSLDITNKLTISLWHNLNTIAENEKEVIMKGRVSSGDNANYVFRTHPDGNYQFFYYNGSSFRTYSFDTSVQTDEWVHVVLVKDWDNGTIELFINGVSQGEDSFGSSTPQTNSDPLRIGGSNYEPYPDGQISDVAIYNKALTQDEVSQLYKAGRTTAKVKVDANNKINNNSFQSGDISDWTIASGNFSIVTGNGFPANAGRFEADSANPMYANPSPWGNEYLTIIGHTYKLSFLYRSNDSLFEFYDWSGSTYKTIGVNTGNAKHKSFTFTAQDDQYYFGIISDTASGDYFEISDVQLVDITNAITPKLQKGLVLDMPLSEPYTEAGSDISPTGYAIQTGITEPDNYNLLWSSNGTNDAMYAYKSNVLDANRKYQIKFEVTDSSIDAGASFVIKYFLDNSHSTDDDGNNLKDLGWHTLTAFQVYTGGGAGRVQFGLLNSTNGDTFEIENISVKELDATVIDLTPYDNNGTVHGATITDSGYSFDGNDDYVDCGNDASLDITDAITVSTWIKPDITNRDWMTIVDKFVSGSNWSYLLSFTDTTGQIRFRLGGDYPVSNTILETEEWYHLVGTYDNNDEKIKLYVDGAFENEVGHTGDIDISNNSLILGKTFYNELRYFDGSISDTKIYNRALSSSEISYLYDKEKGVYK